MDEVGKDAVFYQLAQRYVWLGTKKEKMELLIEAEPFEAIRRGQVYGVLA